jgi:hypothetical protein
MRSQSAVEQQASPCHHLQLHDHKHCAAHRVAPGVSVAPVAPVAPIASFEPQAAVPFAPVAPFAPIAPVAPVAPAPACARCTCPPASPVATLAHSASVTPRLFQGHVADFSPKEQYSSRPARPASSTSSSTSTRAPRSAASRLFRTHLAALQHKSTRLNMSLTLEVMTGTGLLLYCTLGSHRGEVTHTHENSTA